MLKLEFGDENPENKLKVKVTKTISTKPASRIWYVIDIMLNIRLINWTREILVSFNFLENRNFPWKSLPSVCAHLLKYLEFEIATKY